MQFEPFDLELDKSGYRKWKKETIIRPKAFQEHADRLEKEEGRYISIIRNTWLKKVDEKDVEKRLEDGDDLLLMNGRHYELSKSRDWTCAGYIALSDDRFIRVEYNILFLILWPLLGFILFLWALTLILGLKSCSVADAWKPDLDGQASEYTGPQADIPVEQESIVIPGFYKFTATEGGNNLQLYNPEGNTVYFQYEVYKVESSRTEASFPDIESAQAYVAEHNTEYTCEAEDARYVLKDADGNLLDSVILYRAMGDGDVYDVLAEEASILYQTKLISPGQQVLWDAYGALGKGQHDIKLKVSTYDIETGAECYGAIQTVTADVK